MSILKSDPVEKTKKYKSIEKEMEEKVMNRLKDVPKGMGWCHLYWSTKREILWNDYGIEWRSPSQMNPRVMFD